MDTLTPNRKRIRNVSQYIFQSIRRNSFSDLKNSLCIVENKDIMSISMSFPPSLGVSGSDKVSTIIKMKLGILDAYSQSFF